METFSTTFNTGFLDERFAKRAKPISVPQNLDKLPRGKFNFFDELSLFLQVVKSAFGEKCMLLFSSRGYWKPELLAIAFIGFFPKKFRPAVILYGEMYQPNYGFRHLFERIVLKIADRAVYYYVVVSKPDLDSFSQTWNIKPDKIRVCPFFSFQPDAANQSQHVSTGNHVFAGGSSFRNYTPFIDAIELIPEKEFYLCAKNLPFRENYPQNVHVGPVPYSEYKRLIETAAVVVIPLELGLRRSAGMLTYFDAMWAKKPIIITDALGVRDYIIDGETGIVVDGSAESFVQAIRWVLDDSHQHEVQKMVRQAYVSVKNTFTFENHISCLLKIIDDVIALDG